MMRYEWDPAKAQRNQQKHGISFSDAVAIFSDDMALTQLDEFSQEERFITLGMDGFGRLLVVVYTWRGTETIRIISARNGTTHERALYKGDSA